jgi:hypothetical protein
MNEERLECGRSYKEGGREKEEEEREREKERGREREREREKEGERERCRISQTVSWHLLVI